MSGRRARRLRAEYRQALDLWLLVLPPLPSWRGYKRCFRSYELSPW